MSNLSAISWQQNLTFDDDDVCYVQKKKKKKVDQHDNLDIYSAGPLKQHSTNKHVTSQGQIYHTDSEPVSLI